MFIIITDVTALWMLQDTLIASAQIQKKILPKTFFLKLKCYCSS